MNEQHNDFDFAVPDTLQECVDLARQLGEIVLDIDTQLAMFKTTGGGDKPASWHPRALAKKMHTLKNLNRVKDRIRALKHARASSDAIAASGHAQKLALAQEAASNAQAKARRAVKRGQTFYDLVYEAFPENRDAIAHFWRISMTKGDEEQNKPETRIPEQASEQLPGADCGEC